MVLQTLYFAAHVAFWNGDLAQLALVRAAYLAANGDRVAYLNPWPKRALDAESEDSATVDAESDSSSDFE